jgi:hypothetical protein
MRMYWKCVRFLCEVFEDCTENGLVYPAGNSLNLFKEEPNELEDEAEQLLSSQTPVEMLKFIKEIETNMQTDQSLEPQKRYWTALT